MLLLKTGRRGTTATWRFTCGCKATLLKLPRNRVLWAKLNRKEYE